MNSLASNSSSGVGDEQNDPLHQKLTAGDGGIRISQPRLSTKLRKWFVELLTGVNEDGDDDNAIRYRRRRRLLILSALSIILGAWVRSSRRRRQRIASDSAALTSKTSASLWPVSLLMAWLKAADYKQNPRQSTMNLLYAAARDGMIQKAMVGSNAIYFQTERQDLPGSKSKERRWNHTVLPPNNDAIRSSLLEALAAGGCHHVEAIPESIGSQLATPILTAVPFIYLALVYKMMKNQFGGDDISSKLTNGTRNIWGEEELDRTTFADVAGLPSAVKDMSEVVSYLSSPSLYTSMGARPPRGVLLHGPPGSGKTLLARAVAGEAMCDNFTALSGSAFVEMYVGRGASRVRALFRQARRDALRRRSLSRTASWWSSLLGFPSWKTAATLQERPACAIIFIDELDAVAKSRSYDAMHGNDEREQTLNQLLTEMDGFDTGSSTEKENNKEDVTLLVIAASNRVDVIDPAVLRRFDRQIFVGYPDASGRKDILQVHARKITCASNVDWYQLSSDAHTSNFSGADLRNVVNEAALFAVRERSSVVEQTHLLHAARRIRQMKTRTSATPERPAVPTFFTRID